jgi:hypothetical protein
VKKLRKNYGIYVKNYLVNIEIKYKIISFFEIILAIVKDILTPNANNDAEQIAFYERMKGDFIRYEIEIASSNLKESLQNEANHCYLNAKELAENNLPAYHPVRVGIMLNYSVFCFNSKSKVDNALKIAKQAYEVDNNHTQNKSFYLFLGSTS